MELRSNVDHIIESVGPNYSDEQILQFLEATFDVSLKKLLKILFLKITFMVQGSAYHTVILK